MVGTALLVWRKSRIPPLSRQLSQVDQFFETFVSRQISLESVSRLWFSLDQSANPPSQPAPFVESPELNYLALKDGRDAALYPIPTLEECFVDVL